MAFRINSKKFFLTYPRTGSTTVEELLSFLENLRPLHAYVISRELHEDGEPHLHAFAEFRDKINVRTNTFFDFNHHHGNYQGARNAKQVIDYVKKAGDFISSNIQEKKSWSEIIETSTTKETFLESVRSNYARDFVLQHDRVCSFADKFYNTTSVYTSQHSNFLIPEEMTQWVDQMLDVSDFIL